MNRAMIAATLVGILFGASATLAYAGREVDKLNQQLLACDNNNVELQQQNVQLAARLNQPNKSPTVLSIRVQANTPDGLVEMATVTFVKQQLQFLIGFPLTSLQEHPDLPSRLIDGRILTVDQQAFTLRVTTVVIVERLYIEVSATANNGS
ncbi:hypothetical protein D2Q93_01805 [Alicyclobacillaceae bacterium I2511]|nr:hypothetical protein D2Q93_01805 [Alicyclobacillaceae bacterium I2511]